jgi:Protein of unknown function (DUF1003)
MKSEAAVPPGSPPDGQGTPFESERDQTSQNIEAVLDFYTREEQRISRSQRILERISNFVGQPVFLSFILVFVALWMVANAVLRRLGMAEFDPAPFPWLQGIVGLGALLTATVETAVGRPRISPRSRPSRGRPGEGPMDSPFRVEYLDAERMLPVLVRKAA